jgi:hypothetical protein
VEPGRKLGEFVLHEKLGEGAFGVVHRAEQPALGLQRSLHRLEQLEEPVATTTDFGRRLVD